MITKEEYRQAKSQHDNAEKIIDQYHKERLEGFEQRLKDNPIFTDDELRYSRYTLCPCGHGLAYPKECGINHYWDCSAVLKGIADPNVEHTGQLPFAFYSVKAENDQESTRGVFKPRKEK